MVLAIVNGAVPVDTVEVITPEKDGLFTTFTVTAPVYGPVPVPDAEIFVPAAKD